MAPTNWWSNNLGMRHQERFVAKVEISFLSCGNNCTYRVMPQMPPSGHRSSFSHSGFLRGMQSGLAPLFCLLGEEPEEELNPASLEQQHPGHQMGQPQSCLLLRQAACSMEIIPARLPQSCLPRSIHTGKLREGASV